jgi:hypothetical protein
MDYGFAPGTDPQTIRARRLLDLRDDTERRTSGTTVKEFIEDLVTDAGVTKPVGDLLVGAHGSSEGFMFVAMYPGQVDGDGRPSTHTDFETLEETLAAAARSIRVPDELVGFTAPPITHTLHFKGCNIGRDRADGGRTPNAPFLAKFKEALGGHVDVTAPKHFHGLWDLDDGRGLFEYMAYEFVVRTPARKVGKAFEGFPDRNALIAALDAAGYSFADGTAVSLKDWRSVVPKNIGRSVGFEVTVPLGATLAGLKTLTLATDKSGRKGGRELRVEPVRFDWAFVPPGGVPADTAARLAALRADMETEDRFKATHDWPAYERVGCTSLDDFVAGHHWSFSVKDSNLVCVGRRVDYTVLLPIVDRDVTPQNLIFNFYPRPGSSDPQITTGLVPTDTTFFGQA